MTAPTATTAQQRNQLREDIDTLELETKKALLEKALYYAQSNSTSAEVFVRAYVILDSHKLPGVTITGK